MKKIALLIMMLAVSVSMYACGKKTDSQEKEPNSQSAETETVSGSAIDSSMEEIKDFSASISPVQKSEMDLNTVLTFHEKGQSFKIQANRTDDIYEVNFYKIGEAYAKTKDYGMNGREYLNTYYNYYPMDNIYIVCEVPKELPNMVVSFMMKNNQVFEYYISRDSDGDSVSLVKIDGVSSGDFTKYKNPGEESGTLADDTEKEAENKDSLDEESESESTITDDTITDEENSEVSDDSSLKITDLS